jgi:hypothetical protein
VPIEELTDNLQVVPKSSAVVPGAVNTEAVEIRKDHRAMVKYRGSEEDEFQTVASIIFLMAEEAGDKVISNWRRWDEMKSM